MNRLRDVLSGYFRALEREFDFAHSRGADMLLTGYQTPDTIRRLGVSRLHAWLSRWTVRTARKVAEAAVAAANAQHTTVPGERVAAGIVADLATQPLALDDRVSGAERQIGAAFHAHPQAEIIESMLGMGPIRGAELIAAASDPNGYPGRRPARLRRRNGASTARLVPVPRDSGRRTGNLDRPTRYSRKLRRVFYLSRRQRCTRARTVTST